MFVFDYSEDLDIATYEYRIYQANQVEADTAHSGYYKLINAATIDSGTIAPYSQGFNLSNVFTVAVENSTTTSSSTTTSPISYYGAIRPIDTSANLGPWTLITKTSTDTPLIDQQFIGSLTAAKITTGTLGAAEITLNGANSIIKSSNYSAGSLGWKITGLGDAEFNDLTVRTALDIGGSDASSFHVDVNGNLWLGASTYGSAPFKVSNTGALTATGANISGAITAISGTFNGRLQAGDIYIPNTTSPVFSVTTGGAVTASSVTITGGTVGGVNTSSDKLYLGTGTYSNNNTPFFVGLHSGVNKFSLGTGLTWDGNALSVVGEITSTSGTIGGWTIDSNSLFSGTKTASGSYTPTTGEMTIGSDGHISTNKFRINSDGSLFATGADITGSITATSGTITGLLVRTAASGGRAELNAGGIQLYNASDNNVYSFSQNPTYGGSSLFTSWASIGPNNQGNNSWLYDNVIISGGVGAATDITCPGKLFIGGSQAQHTVGYGLSIEKYSGYTTYPGMSIGPISHYGAADYSFLIHDTLGITLINARDDSATNPYHGVQIRLGNVPHTTFSKFWLGTNNRGIDSGEYYTKAFQFVADNIYEATSYLQYNAQWYYNDGYYKLGFTYSNRDAKQDIADMPDMLPLIAKLRPRTFRWKGNENAEVHDPTVNYLHKSAKGTHNIGANIYPDGDYERGFIVEEVEECGHDLVSWHPDSDEPKPMMWKSNDFIAIAIKGIQELSAKVDELESRLL